MNYRLSQGYRVEFRAYAPLHTFKGHADEGIGGEIDIDFDSLTLVSARAWADVRRFTTLDPDRDRAMQAYMDPEKHSEAAIQMTRTDTFEQVDDRTYRVSGHAILSFMGIRRQMPVSFVLVRNPDQDTFSVDIAFKWSFKAYGLKAPRLLFLTVRDIVDIRGTGVFSLAQKEKSL